MPPKRTAAAAALDDAAPAKRGRASDAHAAAKKLLKSILDGPEDFQLPENDEDIIADFEQLAHYTKYLEDQLNAAPSSAGPSTAPKKTPEELEVAAEKIRKAAAAGIKKQMSWKPSCKTNSAKWTYDGVCPDPEVFGHLFKLDGPPTWKMKKFPKDQIEDIFGEITGHARFNELYITNKDIIVRWSDTGEFKMSGTYGVSGY